MTAGMYVGLDSGGTRTNGEIVGVGADVRREVRAYAPSASLAGALEPDSLADVLRRMLLHLPERLKAVNDEVSPHQVLPIYIWIGCAAFAPRTRRHFEEALHSVPQEVGVVAEAIGVANDGVSLLLGSNSDGVVIAGTGSNVLIKSSDGPIKQTGGNEWVACDHGAGFWIGLEGIRAAYQEFEDRADDSILLARLYECYTLSEGDDEGLKSKLRSLSVGSPVMKKNIAAFARFVFDAAERGDAVALRIVNEAAASLGKLTAQAIARAIEIDKVDDSLRIAQCGSLFKNERYRMRFIEVVESELQPEFFQRIEWHRYVTGKAASVALALRLADRNDPMNTLGVDEFTPVIVRR